MSTETRPTPENSHPKLHTLPENLPEELLPLYDWWKTKGYTFLTAVATAAVLAGGVYAFKTYRTAKTAAANQEILKASSLDDLENVVAKFGSTKAGNTARIRLAKAYYDASNYEAALQTYDVCLQQGAPKAFQEIVMLGRAHALEGVNRLDEALTAYQDFEQRHADHFLYPQAVLGVARVLTLQGHKDTAKTRLENLKAEKTGDTALEMAVAHLEGVINRYEPRAERSLFDLATEAATESAPVPTAPASTAAPAPETPATTPAPTNQ